jgi:cytochrome P450
VRAEVAELGGRTPGAADVERLDYTAMVFKEPMRLYPPAWACGRRNSAEDEIGGHRVPVGAEVLVSPWVTHAYLPFGAGPRACIGQYFSMLEATILLAVIVRDYELTSMNGKVPLAPRITLHPAAPVLSGVRALH